jgi:hypothetical protein
MQFILTHSHQENFPIGTLSSLVRTRKTSRLVTYPKIALSQARLTQRFLGVEDKILGPMGLTS